MGAEAGWGIWLEPELPARELADLARTAERAGASHVFVADEGTERDVFVILAALVASTERVTLGTGITNPFSRHPVVLAAAFATLAEMAPGRIVAGLGVGGSRALVPMGLAPERPYSALAESLDVVERLLRGEEVSGRGEFKVRSAKLPWWRGRLEFAVAGRGPRVQRLAARRVEWLLFSGKALDEVAAACAGARQAAAAVGNPIRVAWSAYLAWKPGMIEDVRLHFTYIATDMPAELRRRSGLDDATAERVRQVMLSDGMRAAARLVPDQVVRLHALVGDRPFVVKRLAELREAARPDLFLLPINDYRCAREFIASAAGVLAAAGFKEAV